MSSKYDHMYRPNRDRMLIVLMGCYKGRSYREMAAITHRSTRTVALQIEELVKKGAVVKPAKGKKRSIILTDKGIRMLQNAKLIQDENNAT